MISSTMSETLSDQATLYFRNGSSDKVYHAAIQPSGDGYRVTFAFGRRGTTLTTGTKTASPVEYALARKIFDKLIQEKTAKGYSPGQEGTPYQETTRQDRATGIIPQLLNPIDEAQARQANREGAVFKHAAAVYAPGRPASGGDQLKLKFTSTASCLVAGVNGSKRSVGLALRDGNKTVPVGNVTIPANQPIPRGGDLVEIRYLYAFPGGSLYQPVYLGIRDDITVEACSITQLKFKAEIEDAEMA